MNYNRGCYRQPATCGCNVGKKYADFHKNAVLNAQNNQMSKFCGNHNEMNYKLGMVYAPYQEWQNLFPCEKGFDAGTIFEELNKPFYGYKSNKGGCCL